MKIVNKPWGREEWLILNDKYCLKRLYINRGEKLSLQYHVKKKETMFLESGTCDLVLNDETILMHKNVPYTIQPLDIHTLIAHLDTVILEVSTSEMSDVVRIEDKYGRASDTSEAK